MARGVYAQGVVGSARSGKLRRRVQGVGSRLKHWRVVFVVLAVLVVGILVARRPFVPANALGIVLLGYTNSPGSVLPFASGQPEPRLLDAGNGVFYGISYAGLSSNLATSYGC